MQKLLCDYNQTTQPLPNHKAFNNWDVAPTGWLAVGLSKEIKKGQVKGYKICDHHIIIYRGKNGKTVAMDAFCPHMGMNLAAGKVHENKIACVFHEWTFNETGKCVDIPCQKHLLQKTKSAKTYPVEEKYDLIWIFSDTVSNGPVPTPLELENKKYISSVMTPFIRVAHPHITMMNSIDEQHMRSVHKLPMHLDLEIEETIKENKNVFEVNFIGKMIPNNFLGRAQKILLGDTWKSRVTLIDGCIGILTIMIDAKLLNKFKLPVGQFIFSQNFTERGKTYVWPIIITERRSGIFGLISAYLINRFFKAVMWFLAYQDGRLIYKDLRFSPAGLLPEVDNASVRWISFINRATRPSIWSNINIKGKNQSHSKANSISDNNQNQFEQYSDSTV